MTYLIRGSNSWGEYTFERSADEWEHVKDYVREAIETDLIHPENIEIYECKALNIKITHTIEVSPNGVS